jgi:hypothetical protein
MPVLRIGPTILVSMYDLMLVHFNEDVVLISIRLSHHNNCICMLGLEVSPEAVYITTNVFPFSQGGQAGNRLWILSKSSFYSGGPLSYTKHDPTYGEYILTMMPALVWVDKLGTTLEPTW